MTSRGCTPPFLISIFIFVSFRLSFLFYFECVPLCVFFLHGYSFFFLVFTTAPYFHQQPNIGIDVEVNRRILWDSFWFEEAVGCCGMLWDFLNSHLKRLIGCTRAKDFSKKMLWDAVGCCGDRIWRGQRCDGVPTVNDVPPQLSLHSFAYLHAWSIRSVSPSNRTLIQLHSNSSDRRNVIIKLSANQRQCTASSQLPNLPLTSQ